MPKFPHLLLDANIIICAHEFDIWPQLTENCTITTTRTVANQEARFWRDQKGKDHRIDLNEYIQKGKINLVDVPLAQFAVFRKMFGPTYLDRMDTGEAELLAFLYHSGKSWFICSADGIVFKTLGCLGLAKQGISLEEILQQIELICELDEQHKQYTKIYRLRLTEMGQQEGNSGMAFRL